jgi:hypothetical protein
VFLGLGAQFLDCILKLVQFLAQLGERLLSGIGFLCAFLGSVEIGLLRSIFLIHATFLCVVRSMCAPMLFVEVAMLLKVDFLGDSGHRSSTRSLVSCLALDGSFLVGMCVGLFLCTYMLYCLKKCENQKEANKCPWDSCLSCGG